MKIPQTKISINGLLNIDKPKNITSHDLVVMVRKLTGEKRIGHTGTLDPFATGVMVLCLGKATKLSNMLTSKRKSYRAVMELGVRTDSQDKTGKVISQQTPKDISENDILKVMNSFLGEIEQIPPMYSAVKYKGERLYKLARKGIQVERTPKKVTIYNITLLGINGCRVEFEVDTSPGTYIRTLCDSMGEMLKVGAHLSELKRTRVGEFCISDSLSIEKFKEIIQSGELEKNLIPLENYNKVCYS